MTGTALLLAVLAAGPAFANPVSPTAPVPSPYEACVSWVETLNVCQGGDVDPHAGCAFAEHLEDQTTAALYTCWTRTVQESQCNMEATGQCDVLTLPEPESPADARRARERDRALNWCTRAVDRVDRCGRRFGYERTTDLPVYRCKAAVDAGRMSFSDARRLYKRVRNMSCSSRSLVRRAMYSRALPPPIPRRRCVSACQRYYRDYNQCAVAAGWSVASTADVAASCDVADTCGEYDYVGYYGCLGSALPDRCEDASSPLGNVYQCRLE